MLVNDAPMAAAEAASEGLWSLASSCTGSAIIALGPNTKIESWPGFQVTRITLARRLRSLCSTDSAFYTAKVWLTIHTATVWYRDRETIGKPDVFPEPSASGLTPFIRDLEPKVCMSRSDCQQAVPRPMATSFSDALRIRTQPDALLPLAADDLFLPAAYTEFV
jgi:hypothetical protein